MDGPSIQQGINAANRVASTTDNAAARFDGTTGALQNSAFIVDDTGHVTSFGGNLKFPATQAASADANTLDDYEEGTFTPTITAGTGTFTSVSATGWYRKIGSLVVGGVSITITTAGTAAGSIIASGLPFTAAAHSTASGQEANLTGFAVAGFILSGSTQITSLREYDFTTAIASGAIVHVNFAYIT